MSAQKGGSKDSAEPPASWRANQRRLRNRLAQKAVRERKAARVQQLEQQLATVIETDDSTRVNQLLKSNSRLRLALLDTRKRLGSLSATATQLAQQIKEELDQRDEVLGGSEDVPSQMDVFDNPPHHPWRANLQPYSQSPPTSSNELISENLGPETFENPGLELINSCASVDAEGSYITPVPGHSDKIPVAMNSISNSNRHNQELPDLFPGPHLGPKLRIYSGSTFSNHLDHIHGLLRLGGALECGSRSAMQRSNSSSLQDLEPLMPCSMPHVVEGMLTAFLHHGWPSMKYWFDATQSGPLGARVLWWQTSHSHEAATQIPPGNTPTLIQLSQPKYPCILDWVPHPGLRDRLILNYQSYNVDQVICDMTNAFVVEVEERSPINDQSHSQLDLPRISTGCSCSYNLMELVEQTLYFGPLENHSPQELTVMKLLRSTASSKFSAYPIHSFKLDPRFFDKYPALYDANAESKCRPRNAPIIQKSQLPLPFTTDSVREYMNAVLHAKRTMVVT
ncbi:hypothetical protein K505DRAFT_335587 [Melanomma pulvis-pyrius CBS 109.77]|uniref:BZIP domain-containing protein n=1 Tax=Melanomma pulvis-pyrius CBS 109.77 TaxID=1314802 RepID=A0A6A6XIP5_9PLEO|nr:hypothetical protein K505DRAFT_335587 [Melanomma pulvis-pyrius CBS 109.77]